jgi:hypothetical protein
LAPALSWAQESPFLTGATALQTNILAWMTPVAIIHAASADLAFEQLVLLVKQNEAGREMSRADIRQLLGTLVDVVIQFGVEGPIRYIKEIWYGPARATVMHPVHDQVAVGDQTSALCGGDKAGQMGPTGGFP